MKSDLNFLNLKNIIFLLILLIAATIRLLGIYYGSFAFTFDVGRDLLAASEILQGKITFIGATTGIPGVFYGPWWYFFLAIPIFIFNGDPAWIVTTICIVGILSIYLAFLMGGLVFASLIAFSPHFIGTSVQIWNPNLVPFLILLSFLNLKRLLKNFHRRYFFILGLLTMLIFEMESAFGVFYLTGMTLSLLLLLRKKEIFIYFMGIFLIEIPRIVFELRHDFLQSRSLLLFFSGQSASPLNFIQRLTNRASLFWTDWKANFGGGHEFIAILVTVIFVWVIIKFWQKLDREEKILAKTIFLILMSLFLGLSFYSRDVWYYYLIGLPTLSFLVFSIFFNKVLFDPQKKIIGIVVFLFIILVNFNLPGAVASLKNPRFPGDAAVYRNQVKVIDYIYKDAQGEDFNFVAYTPPLIEHTWRYHFLWYGFKKYGYRPSLEKAKLFYLIEEPDHDVPSRLKTWLDLRKDDGKTISKEEIAGGIVVEKREH